MHKHSRCFTTSFLHCPYSHCLIQHHSCTPHTLGITFKDTTALEITYPANNKIGYSTSETPLSDSASVSSLFPHAIYAMLQCCPSNQTLGYCTLDRCKSYPVAGPISLCIGHERGAYKEVCVHCHHLLMFPNR